MTLTLNTSGTTGTAQLEVPVSVSLPRSDDYSAVAATFTPGGVPLTADVSVSAVNDQLVEVTTETFPAEPGRHQRQRGE